MGFEKSQFGRDRKREVLEKILVDPKANVEAKEGG